jgi:hypothetical protein
MTTRPLTDRRRWWISLLWHNPFYLLSAASMLAGCAALTNSLSFSSIDSGRLLQLMGALNLYELLLVALAALLIRRPNVRYDAINLLILEAFYMVDVAFLNAEIFSKDFRIGVWTNLAVFALDVLKAAVIFRALRIPVRSEPFFLLIFELLLLLATPGVFKYASDHRGGQLPALAIYGIWWGIALVPVAWVWLMRWRSTHLARFADALAENRLVIGALIWLPMISTIAHASTANWVYKVDWTPANLGPLLLGFAIAFGTYDRHVRNLTVRLRAQLLLPVIAVALSVTAPTALRFVLNGVPISPLRIVFAGATLVYIQGYAFHRHIYFAWAASLCLMLGLLGATWLAIVNNVYWFARLVREWWWRMIPKTTEEWGVVAVASSFALLLLGAAVSLLKSATPQPIEPLPTDVLDDEA